MIAADNTFALAAVLLGIVAFGLWAETRSWGRKVSGAFLILVISALAANFGLIPHEAPVYGSFAGIFVPVAIPLLLFQADLARVVRETGPVLTAFLICVVLTMTGALVGAALFDLDQEAKIAGALTASYIGGSVNFVATAQAVEFTDQSLYLATLAADLVGAVVYLSLLMSMPAFALIRRLMPSKFISADGEMLVEAPPPDEDDRERPFDLAGASLAIAVSVGICAIAKGVAGLIAQPQLFILLVTVGALLVANFARPLVRRFHAEFAIGTWLMYAFFAAIGAGADVATVIATAPAILGFILTLVFTHLVLLVIVGRLMRLDLAEVMVASNACILGPATAAAMPAGLGWRSLVTPGLLTGILGYAIGTFCGVGITRLLS